jgi:hypothetical protein
MELPSIRSHERITYKRCVKKWYWAWRRGLVPRAANFGALELGTWMHAALATWYQEGRKRHPMGLKQIFTNTGLLHIRTAETNGAPEHVIEQAEQLLSLGEAMAEAYQIHYGVDGSLDVIGAEIPLEFTISDTRPPYPVIAKHRLKPDLVFMDSNGDMWILETKTAKSIQTEHLAIDDQARPYGAMAEQALRKAKLLKKSQNFKGILYNILRKALPDLRPTNSKGHYLNKDRSVSKRQPPPFFVRKPITLTREAKLITLRRVQRDTLEITNATVALRNRHVDPLDLPKTPHWSCPKTCQFFAMCVAEEQGADTRLMERTIYLRRDPYLYEEDTTDEPVSFEMG